jgi:two-component system CheB/CheR fusion protein
MARLPSAPLEISKLMSGALQPASADFSVAELFAQLRGEFAGVAANQGVELLTEATEECAYSDPSLVEAILRSLVSNAVKYTRQGRVQLRCVREQPSIRIDVLDTGIGIRAEHIAAIFDTAGSSAPADSAPPAAGLGLGGVQRLVKLLNLRLDVTSEPGRGSVFSLRLPRGRAARANETAAAPPAARHLEGHPARVLLVEDDAGVRDATRMLLRVEGYRVTAVATLAEALRSAQEEGGPDLLLTDYHLRDGETGLQVIAALRQCLGRVLRAVLMTGDAAAVAGETSGDPDVRIASKPVNAAELLGVMQQLLAS